MREVSNENGELREEGVVCFRCGELVGDPPRLNTIGEGEDEHACPVCADRLLESLPPIFHSPMPFLVVEHDDESLSSADESDSNDDERA